MIKYHYILYFISKGDYYGKNEDAVLIYGKDRNVINKQIEGINSRIDRLHGEVESGTPETTE